MALSQGGSLRAVGVVGSSITIFQALGLEISNSLTQSLFYYRGEYAAYKGGR